MKNAILRALLAAVLIVGVIGCATDEAGGAEAKTETLRREGASSAIAQAPVVCKKCGSTVDSGGHHHDCKDCTEAKVCAPCAAAVCIDAKHDGLPEARHLEEHSA